MPITDGKVEYERRVTTGDYQHRMAKATIGWANPDNADSELIQQEALRQAQALVHQAVGLTTAPATIDTSTAVSTAPIAAGSPSTVEAPKTRKPRGASTTATTASTVATPEPPPAVAPTTADLAAIEDNAAFQMEEDLAPVVEVTDMDLQKVVQGKVAGLLKADDAAHNTKARQAVTKLIRSYADGVSMIPKDKRHAFITQLEALTV